MTKQIPINGEKGQGQFALVDDDDYERLSQYKWRLSNGYAIRHKPIGNGKYKTLAMQRDVMGCPVNYQIDHKNCDRLDNRKENLRMANQAENSANARRIKETRSGYKGVSFHRGVWDARIGVNYKRIHLGSFHTPEEAAMAYNNAAMRFFGEFARLNQIKTDDSTS